MDWETLARNNSIFSSISRSTNSKPFKVEIAVAVVIFVYSGDVDNILTDILNKYHPDSEQPEAQTLREFVDNLQESKLSTKSNGFLFSFQGQKCCGWTDKNDFAGNEFLGNTNSTVDINGKDILPEVNRNSNQLFLEIFTHYLSS